MARRVLEEVFSIVQERAAQALTQRQAPGERLQKPIHQLQQRGADAAARDDCARLFRITCGAPYKLVQLKIDQAKQGGGPS